VPFGPERKLLVAGQPIELADGRVIQPDEVLGDLIEGAALAVVGDAARVDNLLESVRGVDTLVIESTYCEVEADLARAYGHLTAAQAARLALEAGVKQLILTHVSRRYPEREVLAEARALFPATLVARDFDHYQIKKNQLAQRVMTAPAEEEDHVHA
jgi:ribonuclease Z